MTPDATGSLRPALLRAAIGVLDDFMSKGLIDNGSLLASWLLRESAVWLDPGRDQAVLADLTDRAQRERWDPAWHSAQGYRPHPHPLEGIALPASMPGKWLAADTTGRAFPLLIGLLPVSGPATGFLNALASSLAVNKPVLTLTDPVLAANLVRLRPAIEPQVRAFAQQCYQQAEQYALDHETATAPSRPRAHRL